MGRVELGLLCALVGAAAQAAAAPVLHKHNNKSFEIVQGGSVAGFAHAYEESGAKWVHWHFCGKTHANASGCQASFDADQDRKLKLAQDQPGSYAAWKRAVYGTTTSNDTMPPPGEDHCILAGKRSTDSTKYADLKAKKNILGAPGPRQPDYGTTTLVRGSKIVGVVLRLGRASLVQHEYWVLDDDFEPISTAPVTVAAGVWAHLADAGRRDTQMELGLRLVAEERRHAGTAPNAPSTTVVQYSLNPLRSDTASRQDCADAFKE